MATGSFERLPYDADAYAYVRKANDGILNYNLSVPQPCKPCRFVEPGFNGNAVSTDATRPQVDVESDLFNIGRILSKCPASEYLPTCKGAYTGRGGLPCGDSSGSVAAARARPALKNVPSCEFGQTDSRTMFPPCALRGIAIPRWDPLCLDPQDMSHIDFPGVIYQDNRLASRDAFRRRGPCIAQPMDQTAALPPFHQH
jgi:hypothetical protein